MERGFIAIEIGIGIEIDLCPRRHANLREVFRKIEKLKN
ncbi:hypothetical protein Dret_0062 [Desulfohalobium retbaense DSM 5692]|uniref:Uncharacterized protein n=1 Tax=Desulfohalobium retbaense (strain ATCC 49708 / DSM 5692 / JCM 16813 / HR100) TaxID=485915 RepID=C8WZ89_DESRD|nr:hypothetical protein Dret_0062 [Desulfohalobium retbaense DSM 5692]